MKKSIVALAGMAFAVSGFAQEIGTIGETVTQVADLESGTYLMYANIPTGGTDGKVPGYVYYNSARTDRPFDVAPDVSFTGTVSQEQAKFLWTVTKTADGKYTFTHQQSGMYLPVDPDRNKNMASPETKAMAELTVADRATGIALIYDKEGINKGPWSIFVNKVSDQESNLSYWSTYISGDASQVADDEVKFHFQKVTVTGDIYDYPFQLSDAPSNGQFAENTHWYLLTLSNSYLRYDANTNEVPAGTKGYGNEYWWAFTKGDNGAVKVYNKAAGANKVLSAGNPNGDGNTGGNTRAQLLDINEIPEGNNTMWDLTASTSIAGQDGFNLDREGNESVKANLRDGYMAFWTVGAGEGSTFWVSSPENEVNKFDLATISEYQEKAKAMNAVGTLKDNVLEEVQNCLTTATPENLLRAQTLLNDPESEAIKLNTSAYYRLTTPGRNEKTYMTMNADHLTGTNYDASNASLIWKLNGDAASGYTMANQGRFAQQPPKTSQNAPSTGNADEASKFNLNKINKRIGLWGIKPENDGLHLDAGYNIVGWTNGDASEWYLVEAADIETEITAAGYATVNYPFAVQVPEGVTAYTGTANAEKGVFSLNAIETGIIPANTPVILEGDANNVYTLNIVTEEVAPIKNNALSGIFLSQEIASESNAYILGNGNSGIGFYQMSADDRTLGANKAYLELSASMSHIRSITIGGPTTGIEDTVTDGTQAEEYYDLQGRRVMNPVKGIYVTKSGKKVLFNK